MQLPSQTTRIDGVKVRPTGFPSQSSPGSCLRRSSIIGPRCFSPRRMLFGTFVNRRPTTLTKAGISVVTLAAGERSWDRLRLQETWEEVDDLCPCEYVDGELLVQCAVIFVAAWTSTLAMGTSESGWGACDDSHRGRPENSRLLVRHTMSITDQYTLTFCQSVVFSSSENSSHAKAWPAHHLLQESQSRTSV